MVRLTVSEALSIYPLSEAKLIAGEKGTDRTIQSINIMDAPDIADWIKPGELLFTTAYLLMKDSPDDIVCFIHKLKTRGCVGLGVKLGRFWNDIPQSVIDEADKIGFPLLVLPYQFTFSDQMNALFDAEHKKNTQLLQSVLHKQRELMKYALKKDEDPDLFAAISGILEYPIAVVSARGRVYYNSSPFPDAALTLGMPWPENPRWVKQGPCYRIPLMQDGKCYGFLLVFPGHRRSMKVEEGLFHQVAEIFTFHLGRSHEEQADQVMQNELGALLIQYLQRKMPVHVLIEHGGFHFASGPFRCVWIASASPRPAPSISERFRQIRHELRYHSRLRKFTAQHFELKDGIFSIYSLTPGSREEEWMDSLSALIHAEQAGGHETDGLQMFISRQKMAPDRLVEAYEECREAQSLANRLNITGKFIPYDTVEFSIVFQHVSREIMKAYCDKLLHPLQEKEADYVQEMINTLEVYLNSNGSLHDAAKQLHIHRNTVAYRLEKISECLGIDLKNYNDIAKLKMMYAFRNFMDRGKAG
jgi:purine catabolism regulator